MMQPEERKQEHSPCTDGETKAKSHRTVLVHTQGDGAHEQPAEGSSQQQQFLSLI